MERVLNISEKKPNVTCLEYESGKELYIVGTAHVSTESVNLVEEVIGDVSPDVICVELDEGRERSLLKEKSYEEINIIDIIKKGQIFFFIGQFILANFQRKIAKKTGSSPGNEFKRAVEIASEKNITLVLADRNIGTTLKRAWRSTSFVKKFMLLLSLFGADEEDIDAEDIENLKTEDALASLVKEFGETLPEAKRVLIDERDIYLSEKIRDNLGNKTVAVVGAGHVPGMLEHLKSDKKQDITEFEYVAPPSVVGKIIPWIIPAIIVGVFGYGFYQGNYDRVFEALKMWILVNGGLSALGCLIALSHPLTILIGFIAAPITSLNPTIGAGFVTGIAQTFLLPPRVCDFEEAFEGISFLGWWKNRLTKVFLVFIFSSLGSAIGTWVALPLLMKALGE